MSDNANTSIINNTLLNLTISEIFNEIKANNTNNIITNTTLNDIIESNTTINNINQSKPFLPETIMVPIVNKSLKTNYAFILGIGIPIILIFLIILICYFIKKRMKSKINSTPSDNLEQNKNQMNNSQEKLPYNRIQNTSGLNNNIDVNANNLSEIKVHNLKEEINNIMSNNSGSSSGRRKREKKKSSSNKNMAGFVAQEGQKGIQNEIKEQIKQYVIDEHNNNNI